MTDSVENKKIINYSDLDSPPHFYPCAQFPCMLSHYCTFLKLKLDSELETVGIGYQGPRRRHDNDGFYILRKGCCLAAVLYFTRARLGCKSMLVDL